MPKKNDDANDTKNDKTSDDKTLDVNELADAFFAKLSTGGQKVPEELLASVGKLLKDNRHYRQQLKELRGQALKEGQVAVDKKEYDALVALREEDESTEDFIKRHQRGTEAITALAKRAQDDDVRGVADFVGYNFEVLRDRCQGHQVKIQGEGDDRKAVIIVKGDDGKEQEHDLVTYAEKQWESYLPALSTASNGTRSPGISTPDRRQFVMQPATRPGTKTGAKPVDDIVKDKRTKRQYHSI